MKNFVKFGIYGSLAIVVLAYLFVTLHWSGGATLMITGSITHVFFYVLNIYLEPSNKQNYVALGAFVGLFLFSYFQIAPGILSALLFVSYVGCHLLPINNMAITTNKYLRSIALIGLSASVIGILFKVLHWPRADFIFLISMVLVAMFIGVLGLSRNNVHAAQ